MIDIKESQSRIALIGFCLVMVLAWFCYRPALSGAFQLDDKSNLGGLAQVEDSKSALDFALSGTAGPLGRPIALATFALQADSWEQGATAFLRVNIAIHLVNAALLAFCLYRLSLLRAVEPQKALTVAVATASLWVLMPLHATASLLVVQRMATLSALFMLAGLAGYLLARSKIDHRPGQAMLGMSASLVIGTSLAMFCKESGILLPVFALVLELTVLERPTAVGVRPWRLWQLAFLVLPLLFIVAYLATIPSYPEWLVARRGFTAWERVLTETRMLWLYLAKAVVAIPGQLGVFLDAPETSRSVFQPVTLVASLSWLVLLSASVFWRRRYPLFALAVLWYLAGHLLESTVVPLELYFEHRNYLSIIAALFAISSYLLLGSPQRRRIGLAAMTFMLLANAYSLHSFASIWGEPSLASRYWAMNYPNSVRAVTTMASYQLTEEGPLRTLQTIDNFVITHPRHAYLRIQELNLLCQYGQDRDHSEVLSQLEQQLPGVDFTYTAGRMLSQLLNTAISAPCNDVDAATVATLAGVLQRNPRYRLDPLYNQFHYKLLAGIARQQGNYEATIDNLQRAIEHRPSSELNMMMVTALGGARDFDAANKFIDDAASRRVAHPMQAIKWHRDLDGLRAYIGELERTSERKQSVESSRDVETGKK